jgi:DNA-binding NtrC family response regulator
MTARGEMFVFSCQDEELAALRSACDQKSLTLRELHNPVEVAHQVVSRRPFGVFLGLSAETLENLDLIAMIRAVHRDLPVIIIAAEDSLDLERRARQRDIFYYLIRPIDSAELDAVLRDVERQGKK